MVSRTTETPAAYLADLENLWATFDALIAGFTPSDWQRKHGKDWVFADVPYHLSYFDRDIVANPIERGKDVPAAEQRVLRTIAELNDWNAERFAQRPGGQPVERSLEQMQGSRAAIRRLAASMSEADLGKPAFCSLPGTGWLTAGILLQACRGHTWSELTQLRIRAGRETPLPSPDVARRALSFYVTFLASIVNRDEARKKPFVAVMEFTGPGGGTWTLTAANGACTVSEGSAPHPDLVMSQSLDIFIKSFAHIENPMLQMLTGKVKVRGFMNMGRFGKLFPPPSHDTTMEPGMLGSTPVG